MQNIASDRLRQLLAYWKDQCHFTTETARLGNRQDLVPSFVQNWRKLEERIFDRELRSLNHTEWGRSTILRDNTFVANYSSLPYELFVWSRSGRTATHLPIELQRPFSEAPFPGVRVADIKLPFESFILTLEDPIRVETRTGLWRSFDGIWVTRVPEQSPFIMCRLLEVPHASEDMQRLPKNALRRVEIALRRGGIAKASQEYDRQVQRWHDNMVVAPGPFVFELYPSGTKESDFIADVTNLEYFASRLRRISGSQIDTSSWQASWYCSIAKIVIGWCLYRKFLPSENYSWTEPRLPPLRGSRGSSTGVITNPEHICTILRIGTMDIGKYREMNPDKGGSQFFQWPHVRSGYWRREMGAGPRAPKTVWINSYEVRKDLMPLYGVHGGKVTKVIGDI